MPSQSWVDFDVWRTTQMEARFRKIDKLLDALPDRPEQGLQIAGQIRLLLDEVRELEKAKPPT
jgi:hypothetical protein